MQKGLLLPTHPRPNSSEHLLSHLLISASPINTQDCIPTESAPRGTPHSTLLQRPLRTRTFPRRADFSAGGSSPSEKPPAGGGFDAGLAARNRRHKAPVRPDRSRRRFQPRGPVAHARPIRRAITRGPDRGSANFPAAGAGRAARFPASVARGSERPAGKLIDPLPRPVRR